MRLAGIAMRLQVAPASLVAASPKPVPVQPDTNPTRESRRWMTASEIVFVVVAIALGCVVTDGPMLGEGRWGGGRLLPDAAHEHTRTAATKTTARCARRDQQTDARLCGSTSLDATPEMPAPVRPEPGRTDLER